MAAADSKRGLKTHETLGLAALSPSPSSPHPSAVFSGCVSPLSSSSGQRRFFSAAALHVTEPSERAMCVVPRLQIEASAGPFAKESIDGVVEV